MKIADRQGLTTIRKVLDVFCMYYNIKPGELFNKTRKLEILSKRQMFHYLCEKYTKESYANIGAIGREYGQKVYSHSTILHSCGIVRGEIDVLDDKNNDATEFENFLKKYLDEKFVNDIDVIKHKINVLKDREDLNNLLVNYISVDY